MVHHAAHVAVEAGDHSSLAFVLVRPIFIGIGAVVGHVGTITEDASALVVGVGDDHAPVEEKGAVLVFGDKLEAFIGEQVVRVVNGLGGVAGAEFAHGDDDVGEGFFAFVAPEVVWEMVVGVVLVEVAVELAEALFAGQAGLGRADIAEAPFADESGLVASCLEDFSDGGVFCGEGLGGGIGLAGIAAHAGAAMVLTGHEDAAGGGADGCASVEMGKAKAFGGHAVEMGRGDDFLAVAAEIAVA